MFGGVEGNQKAVISAAAHVTGGGLPGKLGRALKPSGLGAKIGEPFEPPGLLLHCQEVGEVPDAEAYRTWCMGQGMALVSPEPDAVISIAQENGLEARAIGEVTEGKGIRVRNRGHFGEEEWLEF
jgi:phosphoribosylformylglycinamidine cyclo-ligase